MATAPWFRTRSGASGKGKGTGRSATAGLTDSVVLPLPHEQDGRNESRMAADSKTAKTCIFFGAIFPPYPVGFYLRLISSIASETFMMKSPTLSSSEIMSMKYVPHR